MRKVENFELKLNLLNQTYYNNYLIDLQSRNPKYFKEVMDSYLILETDDGYYVVINIAKPGIDKDLWFDDEQPIPEKTEELFIQYNLQMNGSKFKFDNNDLYIYDPYTIKPKDNLVKVGNMYKADKIANYTYKRDLKQDEIDMVFEICNILLDEYIERLKRYYKRYADKVHCRGYWVNR